MLEDMVNLPAKQDKRVVAPKESWRPHLELDATQCSGKIERSRKAGPWIPVEGESNGL